MARIDDRTVGLVLRALRRRRGWTQSELASRAGCSQALVSMVERGHAARLTVETVRRLFLAVDARVQLQPGWRGADLERLLDADHAAVAETLARRVESAGWDPRLEVTYSEFGERGSIDLLALRPAVRAALVCEVKSDIASGEQIARKLDEKARLAGRIVERLDGWAPVVVGVVLVMPESPRLRRLVEGTPLLVRLYPIASRRVATWLRQPGGTLRATWFLTNSTGSNRRRVRARRAAPNPALARRPGSDPNGAEPDPQPHPTILR
jgi:transcriptional regulator with XRE-family HTH domain